MVLLQSIFDEPIECLKNARDVTLCTGPRGGIRSLSYTYTDSNSIDVSKSIGTISKHYRDKISALLTFFKENNMTVREERLN